jgi:uncharacterized circularly permuted ATP-grasp superfamily protein
MTVQDGVQLIGTLGFPIVMVLAFLWFLNNKAWPWLTAFMTGYTVVLEKNTTAMQMMASAISAVGDQIKSQPNTQLATAVTTLIERMDQQHIQLSQQLASTKSEIVMAISGNTRLTNKVYHEVTQEPQ